MLGPRDFGLRGTELTEPGSSIRGSITFQYFEKAAPSSAMGQPECLPRRVSPSVMSRKMLKDRRVFGEGAKPQQGGVGGGGRLRCFLCGKAGRTGELKPMLVKATRSCRGWMGAGAAFSLPCGRAQDMTEASDEEAQRGRGRERSSTAERGGQRAAALRCSLPGGDWGKLLR